MCENNITSKTCPGDKSTRNGVDMALHLDSDGFLKELERLGIDSTTVEHPEVFTVEQAQPHIKDLDGVFAKNLFMKDKKKKLWLFCAAHNADVKLNDLGKMVKASGSLRFAEEDVLYDTLGVRQGAVTLFGLINDRDKHVTLALDSRFLDGTYRKMYFHPLRNSASTGVTTEGLKKFLQHTGHEPVVVDVSGFSASQ